MGWGIIGKGVKAVAPLLGTVLGGPAGGIAGTLIAEAFGVDTKGKTETEAAKAVATAIKGDPEAALKLRKIEADNQAALEAIDAQIIESVNLTMRAESASEHWPQYSWRPFVGFCFPVLAGLVYFLLPALSKPVPAIPESVWIGFGAILGVTAWGRNRLKNQRDGSAPSQGSGFLGSLLAKVNPSASS